MVIDDKYSIETDASYTRIGVDFSAGRDKSVVFYARRCGRQLIVEKFKECLDFNLRQLQPQTKAEKNQARLKQLRGRAGRWA